MIVIDKKLPVVVKRAVNNSMTRFKKFIKKVWLRLALLGLVVLLISQKEFSVEFTIGNGGETTTEQEASLVKPPSTTVAHREKVKASLIPTTNNWWDVIQKESKDIRKKINLANAATAVGEGLTPEQQKQAAKFSNLGFILSPNFAKEHKIDPAIVAAKAKIIEDYIAQYSTTAQEEAELFNIPASITLAQGLLESNAGDSRLAKKDNNHFGIKCRKKCIGCRCANYTDDSRYDMFRIFDSAWGSFREHSKLLTSRRYKHLTKLKITDYKNWAHGLKAAGYATDKRYAHKLIRIIKALDLDRYDKK